MRNRLLSLFAAVAALALPIAGNAQTTGFRNLLVNGEALIANTGTATLTGVNTTPTYGADGFAGYSNNASASVIVGRSTANLPTGFQQAFSLQRTAANTNTTQACLVQEVESARVIPLQGQNVTFSFYGAVGATFSGASSQAQVNVVSGTGTDQGLSSLLSGWTGASTLVSNTAVTLSTAYSRNGVSFTVPTNATELAVQLCWTPVGTAGATDTLFMTGAQLELQLGTCPAVPGSAGYTAQVAQACASPYEHLPIEEEIARASRYFQQFNEANVTLWPCMVTGSNTQACPITLPVQMRVAPTASISAGGLQMIIDGAAGTAVVSGAGATGTPNVCNFTFANTTTAAAHGVSLRGSLTTGIMACSARF
jgi:hypothetical protein